MASVAGLFATVVYRLSTNLNRHPTDYSRPPTAHRQVHDAMMEADAYPSPLNYYNFPKSVCTSVNEVGGGLGAGVACSCY